MSTPLDRRSAEAAPEQVFESRRRDRDGKREAVLRTAARLFLEFGYQHTTLSDVAERLNITKPALYRYFQSKDDILFECWAAGFRDLDESIAETDAGEGSGLAKLRQLIRCYAGIMATDFGASVVRFDIRDLSEANQQAVRTGRHRVDGKIRAYIVEGIADGSVSPCDPKLAAFAIAGSLNWIGYWYQGGGALSPAEIGAEFGLRLTEGLAKPKD